MSNKFPIEIDKQKVYLKTGLQAAAIYQKNFKKNLAVTMYKYSKQPLDPITIEKCDELAQIVWAFAKCANPKIPKYRKWIDSFNVFPLREIFKEILIQVKDGE